MHGALAKGLAVNLLDNSGNAALHYAARAGNRHVCSVLFQHGALANLRNGQGETALHLCVAAPAAEGWDEVARLLLDRGADPNALDDSGRSPLLALQSQPVLPTETRALIARMQRMREHDIQAMPDANSATIRISSTDASVQKRVRKVVAVGALAASVVSAPGGSGASIGLPSAAGGSAGGSGEARRGSSAGNSPRVGRPGSREPAALDLALVGPGGAANMHVEYGRAGVRASEVCVTGLFQVYQNVFFGQSHFLYGGRIEGVGCKIVCVLRLPDAVRCAYRALLFGPYGIFERWLPQRDVIGEELVGGASPRDLEQRLLAYLREHWSSHAIDLSLLDDRFDKNAASFGALLGGGAGVVGGGGGAGLQAPLSPVMGERGGGGGERERATWAAISASKTDLPCLLLGLECRLGLGKRMTVGVLVARGPAQSDEELFANKTTAGLERLMGLLASRVPAKGWTGYMGGMSDLAKHLYYTSWRGFELVFHVAPDLSPEQQRQFVGNDKCVLVLAEGPEAPVPRFRGNVNSVAVVVRCLEAEEAQRYDGEHLAQWGCPAELLGPAAADAPHAWRVAVYHRKRIVNFQPLTTTSLVRDPGLLRDLVCANAINGISATLRSPPYSQSVDACFAQETELLVSRFLPPESGKKK